MKGKLVKLFSILACGVLAVGLSSCTVIINMPGAMPSTSSEISSSEEYSSLEEDSSFEEDSSSSEEYSSKEDSSSSEEIVKPEPTEGVMYRLSDDGTYAPIPEITMIQKQMVVIIHEFAPDHDIPSENPGFRAYRFGPYTERVDRALDTLYRSGYILIST